MTSKFSCTIRCQEPHSTIVCASSLGRRRIGESASISRSRPRARTLTDFIVPFARRCMRMPKPGTRPFANLRQVMRLRRQFREPLECTTCGRTLLDSRRHAAIRNRDCCHRLHRREARRTPAERSLLSDPFRPDSVAASAVRHFLSIDGRRIRQRGAAMLLPAFLRKYLQPKPLEGPQSFPRALFCKDLGIASDLVCRRRVCSLNLSSKEDSGPSEGF